MIDLFLRDSLSDAEQVAFEAHLATCSMCRDALSDSAAEPELWDEAAEALSDDALPSGSPIVPAVQGVLNLLAPELLSNVVDEVVSQAATLGRMIPSWNLVSLATSMRCLAASSVRQC